MNNKNKKARAKYRAKQKLLGLRNKKKHEREKRTLEEIERLIPTVNPRAEVPLTFAFWSPSFQLMWLRSNQRKIKGKTK